MSFSEYIERRLIEERLFNIAEVRASINEDWVKDKILNHCNRFSGLFTYNDILNTILSNDIVASCFAKDPLKQNLVEKECAKWIGVDKLPASGKNCIRFDIYGEITAYKGPNASKSADFLKDGIYYTQKYTGANNGGAQDNQYDDVVTFLRNGSINYKVGAIVDGAYWDELGHRELLKQAFEGNKNVFIVSADDLKE